MTDTLIGNRYRQQTLMSLFSALYDSWNELLRGAHAATLNRRAAIKLALSVAQCRLMLILVGDQATRALSKSEACNAMLALVSKHATLRKNLHLDVLFMLQVIQDRMNSCRKEALRARQALERTPGAQHFAEQAQSWWRAHDQLRRCRDRILDSGFLAEIPATSKISVVERERVVAYAGALQARWIVCERALRSTRIMPIHKPRLEAIRALPLFRPIRETLGQTTSLDIDAIVDYIVSAPSRQQRSFYAEVAEAIAQLQELAREQYISLRRASNDQVIASIRSVLSIINITLDKLLEVRLFATVGE